MCSHLDFVNPSEKLTLINIFQLFLTDTEDYFSMSRQTDMSLTVPFSVTKQFRLVLMVFKHAKIF